MEKFFIALALFALFTSIAVESCIVEQEPAGEA